MTPPLHLRPVNAEVYGVHGPNGELLGFLKRIGGVWKFKAVGLGADGVLEPGGGPLTAQHNAAFDAPDEAALNARFTPIQALAARTF